MAWILAVMLWIMTVQPVLAQQQVLSLESPTSQFQSVRPQGLLNNTVPLRPLYNLPVIPCIATAAAPVHTEGAFVNCSTDLAGNLRTSGGGGGGGGGTSSSYGAAFPATGTAAGFSDGTNMQGARAHDSDSGAGSEYNLGSSVRCVASGGSTACFPPTATSGDGAADQVGTYIHGYGYMYNGATWDRVRGSIASGLLVNVSNATLAVTQSGAWSTGRTWTLASGTDSVAAVQSGTWNINNISGTISLPTGAATEATLSTRLADATFTGRFAVAFASADAIANQTTTVMHGFGFMYNGTTWDRIRGTIAAGILTNVSNAFLLDATLTNRLPAGSTPADNESNAITTSRLGVYNYIFDGTTWDRWTGAVTGSGNFTVVQPTGTNLHIVCDSGCGGAATFADNAAFTFGTTAINNMGAVVDDTATNTVTENSAGAPRMNTNRILYGMPTNGSGVALYPTAAALADATANPTLTQIGTFIHGYNGTTWDRWTGAVTQSGTWNINAVTSITNTVTVQGTKTNNSAAPGTNNIGALPCIANAADPTWTEGNQVGCSTTLAGAQRVEARQATAANLNVRPDTSGATGAAPPARANFVGGLSSGATGGLVQGVTVCDTFANVNVNTATTTLIVTGVSGRHVRICSMNLVATAAQTVAFISGTGGTCGTGTTGMNGGTSAATGWSFAAGGGITQGSGLGEINRTNATGDSVCVVTGAAAQLSGRIAYAIY